MAGTKVAVDKVAKPKEKAAANTSNTEATQQQPTSQVVDEAKNESEAQLPVTDPPVTTEGQESPSQDQQGDAQDKVMDDDKPSLIKGEEAEANTETITETQDEKNPPVVENDIKPKQSEKNPFELRIKNNGRRRLLQFCGVFLEAGQTTIVTLQNQPEVDHIKDTLRQFNELAGRDDLIVEETE